MCNAGFATGLYAVVFRLPWRVGVAVLPALALVVGMASGRICKRVLDAPAVEQPLTQLYSWIGLLQ